MVIGTVRALTFDVFGTVVDWRSAIVRDGRELRADVDWAALADDWRRLYRPTIDAVTRGEVSWATFDVLQRRMLDRIVAKYALSDLTDAELAHLATVWERMTPWPDAVDGLRRLRERFVVCALSNGSLAQLVALAKFGRLPWDAVLSVELFRAYKPDPRVYRGAAELLQRAPSEVAMVACHPYDLEGARACGLATAYVARPLEWGADAPAEVVEDGRFDLSTIDFHDLATRLGA
jgi:2-haloacid dehalogenase